MAPPCPMNWSNCGDGTPLWSKVQSSMTSLATTTPVGGPKNVLNKIAPGTPPRKVKPRRFRSAPSTVMISETRPAGKSGFASMAKTSRPGPLIVNGLTSVGNGLESRKIVPATPAWNTIVSASGVALAAVMASRRESTPSLATVSAVVVTTNVAASRAFVHRHKRNTETTIQTAEFERPAFMLLLLRRTSRSSGCRAPGSVTHEEQDEETVFFTMFISGFAQWPLCQVGRSARRGWLFLLQTELVLR